MADDLGDSHPNSLQQGGGLPANSTALRTVGRIFPAAGKTVTIHASPQALTNRYELLVLANSGAQITNAVGSGILTLTYAPPADEYETIQIHSTGPAPVPQRVSVEVNYTAPTSLKSASASMPPPAPSFSSLKWLRDGRFQFTVNGGTGVSYVVQASPDLTNWSAITTNIAPFNFTDTTTGNAPVRMYRSVYPKSGR